jgi:acetylglutamate kinase
MMTTAQQKTSVLIEALPYLQKFDDRFIVIKMGGSTMSDDKLTASVMTDLVFLEQVGMRPVLVHGGGPRITAAMENAGLKANFVKGRRVTDEATLQIAQRVLIDDISHELCAAIEKAGGKAIPLNGRGSRFLECAKKSFAEDPGLDMGFVGEVTRIDTELVGRIAHGGVIGVVAPIARGPENHLYNVNADSVAWKVAAAVKAEKLVFLSNVPGILQNKDDLKTLLSTVTLNDCKKLTADGVIVGGMIPKVEACLAALECGVRKTHIVSGALPHALLLEIFTDAGIGTEIQA